MLYPETTFGTPETVIMDPVHGAIPVYAHELRVIDDPLFQRLRFIRQNDVTEFVFPGATHSRFSHSIGVMHIAGRCFQALVHSGIEKRRVALREALTPAEQESLQYFLFLIRLAALLHDVGHGPFSHEFEKHAALHKLLDEQRVFEKLWKQIDRSRYLRGTSKEFKHENLSLRIALHILQRSLRFTDNDQQGELAPPFSLEVDDVICVMDGAVNFPSAGFAKHVGGLLSIFEANPRTVPLTAPDTIRMLLRSLLAGTVNADSMDWVLRDSYFSGSTRSPVNIDHLIASLRLYFRGDEITGNTSMEMVIAEKGIGTLEDFAYARLHLYKDVYSHRAVVGLKVLLQHAIGEVLADRFKQRRICAALSDISQFRLFHDQFLWEMINDVALGDSDSACHDLISRKKLHFLERLSNASPKTQRDRQYFWTTKFSADSILTKETKVRADPTDEAIEPIRVLTGGKAGPPKVRDLQDFSRTNYKFLDQRTFHIFRCGSGWARNATPPKTGPGFFIAAVGIPCCGKSTVMRYLAAKLGASYFREPEEPKWPEAVMNRDLVGPLTAITWFRSVRVPHLYNADEIRKQGGVSVIDSYYDKLCYHYLGKKGMGWLIEPKHPYFPVCREMAKLDWQQLPNADLLIVFKVQKNDWEYFLKKRNRHLDRESAFVQSFKTQQLFLQAAKKMLPTTKVHVFERRLVEGPNPTEIAAETLLREIQSYLPKHLRKFSVVTPQ